MVWGPNANYAKFSESSYLQDWVHKNTYAVITSILPIAFMQKIYLTTIFFIAGASMHALAKKIIYSSQEKKYLLPTAIAGIFYATNSFIITRFLMGQHVLLFAYALTPLLCIAWLQLLQKQTVKNTLVATLLISIITLTSIHHLYIIPMLLGILSIKHKKIAKNTAIAIPLITYTVIIFLTILHYLVISKTPTILNAQEFLAYAPNALYTNSIWIDTILLTANWKTNLNYFLPHELISGYSILWITWIIIMSIGIKNQKKEGQHPQLINNLLLIFITATILAIGISSSITRPITQIIQQIPYSAIMRDTGKWMSLIAISESIFLACGIHAIIRVINTQNKPSARKTLPIFYLAILCITFYFISPAVRGITGQIKTSSYPASWYNLNNALPKNSTAIFFPWHQYLSLSFTNNNVVANPAPSFFTNIKVISGDNAERNTQHQEQASQTSQKIQLLLEEKSQNNKTKALKELINSQNISYIVLNTDNPNSKNYNWLFQQSYLTHIINNSELSVWQFTP